VEPLFKLPSHLRQEARCLDAAGITNWQQLAALDDGTLQRLGRGPGVSALRLTRLRGQARLVVAVGLQPAEAALLLHAGVASARGLAEADPHRLLQQITRLQRQLTGSAVPWLDLATLRSWMQRAGRSTN
jgi:hypothetical protein